MIAVALAAFLLGFAVRGFVLPNAQLEVGMPGALTFETPQGAPGTAPLLTEEQVQQEQMPENHPPIGETATTPAPPATSP